MGKIRNYWVILVLCFVFKPHLSQAYHLLEFFDWKERLFFEINLQTKTLNKYDLNKKLVKSQRITMDDFNHEYVHISEHYFHQDLPNGNVLLPIWGSGLVLELDQKNNHLKRLDKTLYAGYNFGAIQFVYKGKLISMGGSGYWTISNRVTFFDTTRKEWELLIYPKSSDPARYTYYLSGYLAENDQVFVTEMLDPFSSPEEEKALQSWILDLKTLRWSNLGKLNKLASSVGFNDEFKALGGLLFFNIQNGPYLADPKENQVYKLILPDPTWLLGFRDLHYEKGWYYFLHYTNDQLPHRIDSLNTSQLLSFSKKEEKLYLESANPLIERVTVGAIGFIAILAFLYLIQRIYLSSSRKSLSIEKEELPLGLIRTWLEIQEKQEISSDVLNELLHCEKKSFDAQRQIRARFISKVNQYFSLNHDFDEFIERIKSKEDKRYMVYRISEDGKRLFLKHYKS